MKTLLLASKYEVMSKKIFTFEDEITIEDVKTALEGIIIDDVHIREVLYSTFRYTSPESIRKKYTQNMILEASKHKKIDFDDSLKGIISDLAKQNILKTSNKYTKIFEGSKGFERLREIKKLKAFLNEKIINQESAVEAVCDALVKAEHIQNTTRPKGIFFFLGPPATGKTYLAQILHNNLEGYEHSYIFDMTQFTHEDSGGGLYGTSRNFGNTKPGVLTSFVRRHPRSIIVFDEFEKANTAVQSNLLSILSNATLRDACGWCGDGEAFSNKRKDDPDNGCSEGEMEDIVDFSQTILIFTSNLGKEVYNNRALIHTLKNEPSQIEKMVYDAITREVKIEKGNTVPAITPEMLSRLKQGSMVLFNRLDYYGLQKISIKTFNDEKIGFEKSYNISLVLSEYLEDLLLLNFAPDFDIREIKSSIGKIIFDSITDYFIEYDKEFTHANISLDKDAIKVIQEILIDKDEIIRSFQRKNKRVFFGKSIKLKKDTLHIVFNNLHIETIKKAKDFGEGGVSIETPNIAFDDIAGHTYVKEQLKEVVGLLKDSRKLHSMGARLSKGMLLYGPPGTGKTMLAKALASEADLPFISTTGQELLSDGMMSKIFSTAREYAPSIIFIDEIDAIPTRGTNAYMDTVVNQLLTQIDGFDISDEEPVFVIAATNREKKLDPALTRSGRIDIQIEVGGLDREARAYFINKMVENPTFDPKIDKEQAIKFTASLNGSDLEKIARECILYVYRKGLNNVTHDILLEQINTIKHGRRIENKNLQDALDATAYHEAGHAVLSKLLTPFKRIEQVTVMPRNKSLGFVSFSFENGEYFSQNVNYIKDEICVLLAGRIAQKKQFGDQGIDSGASSDLEAANRHAYRAIAYFGMDDVLKNMSIASFEQDNILYRNEAIFERINAWISEATQRTETLVNDNWSAIKAVANLLIKDEQIDEITLDTMINNL